MRDQYEEALQIVSLTLNDVDNEFTYRAIVTFRKFLED